MNILINALVSISVLALVAVGLYIIYGLMGVINMAHGEMLTIGAYATMVATGFGAPFWAAVAAATAVAAVAGFILERLVIRHLYGAGGLSTLLATWGVSIALQQLFRIYFGPSAKFVAAPMSGMSNIFGVTYPTYRLVLMAAAIVIIGLLIALYRATSVGLQMRAIMDGADRAEAMGVNTRRMYLVSFIIGSGLAGFSGAMLAPLAAITPLMGLEYVVQSFLVVMVGGVGSVLSPLGGAALVAGLSSLMTNFTGATIAQIAVLGLVVVAIYFRPNGLFGREAQR